MGEKAKSFIGNEAQNESFESFAYTKIYWQSEPLITLVSMYRRILVKNNLHGNTLELEIKNKLELSWLNENSILSTQMKNSTIYVYLSTWDNIKISFDNLREKKIKRILWKNSRKIIEENVVKLQSAIETIYSENKWIIWNGEINNEDTINVEWFWSNLTLMEIKALLDKESKKLKGVYKITWETKKYTNLLKTELKFYVWIGDKYEGWARYFSMSQREIDKKVRKLSSAMSISEMIEYIKYNNEQIENNYKESEMANQVNKKFINSLYRITFGRLKTKNATNKDFIDFAKALTGRGKLEVDKDEIYKKKDNFDYDSLDIDDEYLQIDMANKALIFVMYRKNWVLDELKEKHLKSFKIEDEEVWGKSPSKVVSEGLVELSKLNKKDPNYWKDILKKAWFWKLIGTKKDYNELNFDEKISLWAIARITKILKEASPEELKNPDFIKLKVWETAKESFEELNDSFSDNIDWWGWVFWKSAEDLWLSW